jgi:RHS repeat-associated protein
MECMFGAAKRKNSLVGVATVVIVALVAMCVSTSAAMASVASSIRDVSPKSRAEIFFSDVQNCIEFDEKSPGGALGKYDSLVVVALECTSVRKGAGTSGTIHYYHRNQQYSVTAVTTSTGAVAERYAYSAYGEPTVLNAAGSAISSSSISNRNMYTGREWDSTVGFYHFRARWMSPKTGRFLGRDPIGYLFSLSLTRYVRNMPVNLIDPSGLFEAGAGTIGFEQLTYAALNCVKECAGNFPTLVSTGCEAVKNPTQGKWPLDDLDIMNQMSNIFQEGNSFATTTIANLNATSNERNHSALRHCFSSAKYSKLLGCKCSGCMGHFREEHQYHQGQGLNTTQRQDFNNSIGRGCAGCSGPGNLTNPARCQAPGHLYPSFCQSVGSIAFKSDNDIAKCCTNAFVNNLLWLGPTQPPNTPTVPYPRNFVEPIREYELWPNSFGLY